MSTFRYKAKKGTNEVVSGQVDARTQEEAVELVNQLGLLPISVEVQKTASQGRGVKNFGKVRTREVYIFSRQLSGLIKAGIPILKALKLIGNQTQNVNFKDIIKTIESDVKDGKSFSECLDNYPQVFSPLYSAMIRAGEEGGNLKEMLMRMSQYLQSQEEISSKVRTALAYPILMAVVGLGTVIFILTGVIPKIAYLFTHMGQELPLPTKILISTSDFIRGSWYWLLVIVAIFSFVLRKWGSSSAGRVTINNLQLRIPLCGDLILKSELARFCRTLGLLLRSGIPLIRALKISIPIVGNKLMQDGLQESRKQLETGASFGKSLEKMKLIPPMLCNLIAVGEESGSLEESLGDVADSFEQDANEKIKTMTTLLEPLMILVVGAIVGFMVMAMLLPIFQMDILAG